MLCKLGKENMHYSLLWRTHKHRNHCRVKTPPTVKAGGPTALPKKLGEVQDCSLLPCTGSFSVYYESEPRSPAFDLFYPSYTDCLTPWMAERREETPQRLPVSRKLPTYLNRPPERSLEPSDLPRAKFLAPALAGDWACTGFAVHGPHWRRKLFRFVTTSSAANVCN